MISRVRLTTVSRCVPPCSFRGLLRSRAYDRGRRRREKRSRSHLSLSSNSHDRLIRPRPRDQGHRPCSGSRCNSLREGTDEAGADHAYGSSWFDASPKDALSTDDPELHQRRRLPWDTGGDAVHRGEGAVTTDACGTLRTAMRSAGLTVATSAPATTTTPAAE
jgi:hypothetical protein